MKPTPQEVLRSICHEIGERHEELVRAFIAKTGFCPTECELVHKTGLSEDGFVVQTTYVRRKGDGEWRPVSELPEVHQYVLAADKAYGVTVAWRREDGGWTVYVSEDNITIDYHDCDPINPITHWMPIPEGPL